MEQWQTTCLGDACQFINGLWKGDVPPLVRVGVIRNTNFAKDGTLDDSDIAYLDVEAKKYAKRRLQFGDLILEKSGGGPKQPVGRVILFDKTEGEYSFSNFTAAIRISDPSLADALRSIASSNLFSIPESLLASVAGSKDEKLPGDANDVDRQTERAAAIQQFLLAPFSQVERFVSYVSGEARFDTHQGVKGLEFDRVMVIMDDKESRGFMFKYENLFGGKGAGEPSVEGVRRLFYVTCSRARQSLALVAYTDSPERVHKFVTDEGWFSADEIVVGVSTV